MIVITGALGLIGRAFTEACLQFMGNVVGVWDIEKMNPDE